MTLIYDGLEPALVREGILRLCRLLTGSSREIFSSKVAGGDGWHHINGIKAAAFLICFSTV